MNEIILFICGFTIGAATVIIFDMFKVDEKVDSTFKYTRESYKTTEKEKHDYLV